MLHYIREASFLQQWNFCHKLIELLGDILKQKPSETDGVESVIVVDNVPRVEPDKLEKLQSVINKVLGKFGPIVNQHYPMNENDGKTKGLA